MIRLGILIVATIVCMNVDMSKGCSCDPAQPINYCTATFLLHVEITKTALILPGTSYAAFLGLTTGDIQNMVYHQHNIEIIEVIRKPNNVNANKLPKILQTRIQGSLCGLQLNGQQYLMDARLGNSIINADNKVLQLQLCRYNVNLDTDASILTNPPSC